ncbi:hypothetical protein OGAPHI_004394 [Ogataea philodendri]|uniref:Uncharacterized protein n=1 Tax=Ogataea philodendri TaxID=1378263 RepID=A0A9P8P717_9ASCO|nr:uncharacterized protein OGAPHI_004394 [Ogataea philodendri]KAH3666205.1 hypothetical protein OGAPHI_004394 [Ogataea philodendri]
MTSGGCLAQDSFCFNLKLVCVFGESELNPTTVAPNPVKTSKLSRNPTACLVQPGVEALGYKNTTRTFASFASFNRLTDSPSWFSNSKSAGISSPSSNVFLAVSAFTSLDSFFASTVDCLGFTAWAVVFCFLAAGAASSTVLPAKRADLRTIGYKGFVIKQFPKLPDGEGKNGTENWSDPVDPVVHWEGSGSNTWTESSGWVQTSTGVVDTDQVTQEQRETNAHRSVVGQIRLLDSGHQNSDTEQGGTEHLDEETSALGASTTKTVSESNRTWGHGRSSTSSSHTGNHLGEHHDETTNWRNSSGKHKSQGDSRVEVTTGNSAGEENSDHDTETETERDHDQLSWVGALAGVELVLIGNLGNHVGNPQEDEGSNELTRSSNQVVLKIVVETKLVGLESRGVAQLLFSVHFQLARVNMSRYNITRGSGSYLYFGDGGPISFERM